VTIVITAVYAVLGSVVATTGALLVVAPRRAGRFLARRRDEPGPRDLVLWRVVGAFLLLGGIALVILVLTGVVGALDERFSDDADGRSR
jgi:RsiW-degrading membrane proteinase PrsW (M82 family)